MTKNDLDELVNNIIESASNSAQKSRLQSWQNTCEAIEKAKAELTIAGVVRQMINNGHKLSNRTVYNKGNPYRQIFDLWSEYILSQKAKSSTKSSNKQPSNSYESYRGIDLSEVKNPVLRYQITLMQGELKSCKNQLDLLNDVRNQALPNPALRISSSAEANMITANQEQKVLSDYELDIIKELLQSSDIQFDENGKMVAATNLRKGTGISSEGLKQALEKVVSNH